MVNIHPLYSSSSGNMFHIGTDSTNILIDVGVTYKAIKDGLESIHLNTNALDAIFITHEHIDHIKGLPIFCKNVSHVPIYACEKTAVFLKEQLKEKNITANIIAMNYEEEITLNSNFHITPFETSHDALMPCGFHMQAEDKKIAYATDLGYVSDSVFEHLKDSNFTVLESNYDKMMLDYGKYPYPIKMRIKSVTGHLSNEDSATTIKRLIKEGQTKFLLAHLSTNNNDQLLAKDSILEYLAQNDVQTKEIQLHCATKPLSSEEFCIC